MDTNNKQQRTDLNQEAANKIPHNEQQNKVPADRFRNGPESEAKADAQQPGESSTNTSQHSNGGGE